MNELALFAGIGGGILGGKLLGWRTVCGVEIDPYARSVLIARQNDRCLPTFPIWDDIKTFDGKPWQGIVDVVSGGFPCQDISAAGKGAGITGERSWLWREMARVVGEVRPKYVLLENSPMLVSRGLGLVLSDLAQMGYDARWGVVGADDAGYPSRRKRLWAVAHIGKTRGSGQDDGEVDRQNCNCRRISTKIPPRWNTETKIQGQSWNTICRVDDGIPFWMERIAGLGNAQVPAVVELAWRLLSEGH